MQIHIHPDKPTLGRAAAAAGASLIRTAIAERGAAAIIVATGASQFEMLENLVAQPDLDWSRVTAFHLDEYIGLPITHPASFRLYLWRRFVSKLPLPLADFHYLHGDRDPQTECQRVGAILRDTPIDVAFVGIGENGHLAFNDPPADFDATDPYLVVNLDEACRRQQLGEGWFATLDDVPRRAISMSVRQILSSREIICTVPDQRKAVAVARAVEGPITPDVPASILQRHARCELFLDKSAAEMLIHF
ncbi:MAG: glucosamine-6-phosphate deaminase [Pirellulales bacterium]|nr:glucosamine-6-phosphate deaminase [Pirellulales bacterium]